MIFAIMAIVLIATAGAAVDFTELQQSRTRAQVALDAAALALQPNIYTDTTVGIQQKAQALLSNRLADGVSTWPSCNVTSPLNKPPCATVITPTVSTTNGTLTLTANLIVPTNFVNMVGVQSIPAQILSTATRKKLYLEVAMVLDNSGSMNFTMGYNSNIGGGLATRMDTLHSAATCASNILFYGVTTCSASTSGLTANPNVKIGLVPFTQEVNVGTANANASWMDRTGNGNISDNNFDNDDYDNWGTTAATVDTFAGPVDRIALFSKIKDKNGNALSWGGCVEARKSPYDTDDTTPSSGSPDTMITPLFAADEAGAASSAGSGVTSQGDTFYNSYIADTSASCKKEPVVVWTQTKTKCNKVASGTNSTAANNYTSASCTGATTNVYSQTDQNGIVTAPGGVPATLDNNPVPASSDVYTSSGSSPNITNIKTSTYTYIFSNREYQERICKYTGSKMTSSVSAGSVFGPNGDCTTVGITPLTSTPATVDTAIAAMQPLGGTNITEGAVWGFRVLSPTAPFTEGNAYSSTTAKVLIIMTDGENTIYPGTNMNYDTFYSAYGFPWNNRLGVVTSTDTTLEAVMNTRLTTVCTNAKNAGITIYTIGVDTADTTNPSATVSLLTGCASSSGNAYFPNTASDLTSAFQSIANQLAALRLSQ